MGLRVRLRRCDGGTGVGGVHIRVDLATLAGLSEASGDLGGYGPVIADIARQFAQHQVKGRWQWTVYGPNSDQPIATGITRRRPTASQAREVLALNPTCIHPGCRMPSTECDIDHRIPWADSHATKTADLAPLCRHHHVVRHRDGWTYERRDDGDHVFTSPFGHKYTTSGRSP